MTEALEKIKVDVQNIQCIHCKNEFISNNLCNILKEAIDVCFPNNYIPEDWESYKKTFRCSKFIQK